MKFKGLMAMGKLGDRDGFKQMVRLKNDLIQIGCGLLDEEFVLSMGTS